MAITQRCTQCGEAQKEARIWAVAAWQRADRIRVAYKHRLCLTCAASRLAPLQVHSDTAGMTCPGCGIDTTSDYDAVYITWIPKGVGELKAECPFCDACAALFRIWFQEGAEELEDRQQVVEGRPDAPQHTAAQVLAALGIEPRA